MNAPRPALLILLASISGLGVGVARVIISFYAVELHATEFELGLIAGAQSIGIVLTSLPMGILVQRYGSRLLYALGGTLGGIVFCLTPLVPQTWFLILCTVSGSFVMPARFVALNTVFLSQLETVGVNRAGWFRATHMVGFLLVAPVLAVLTDAARVAGRHRSRGNRGGFMNTRILISPHFTFSVPALPQALQSAARVLWRALPSVALGVSVPLGLLALWQFVYVQEWIAPQILPSPQQTWEGFCELYASGDLALHLSASLQRVAWSVAAGGGIGLALGFVLSLSPRARAWIYPSFEVFAQFPVIGWIPLLMLFIGIDEGLKITAISLAVIVPVAVSTYKGILSVPCALLEVGRVHAFSRRQSLLRIVVPAALPAIFTGVRQGVMQAWLALIFVELLAASEGLGFLMIWSRQLMYMDLVFVAIIAIGIIGYALDLGLRRIENRFNRWKPQGL